MNIVRVVAAADKCIENAYEKIDCRDESTDRCPSSRHNQSTVRTTRISVQDAQPTIFILEMRKYHRWVKCIKIYRKVHSKMYQLTDLSHIFWQQYKYYFNYWNLSLNLFTHPYLFNSLKNIRKTVTCPSLDHHISHDLITMKPLGFMESQFKTNDLMTLGQYAVHCHFDA